MIFWISKNLSQKFCSASMRTCCETLVQEVITFATLRWVGACLLSSSSSTCALSTTTMEASTTAGSTWTLASCKTSSSWSSSSPFKSSSSSNCSIKFYGLVMKSFKIIEAQSFSTCNFSMIFHDYQNLSNQVRAIHPNHSSPSSLSLYHNSQYFTGTGNISQSFWLSRRSP